MKSLYPLALAALCVAPSSMAQDAMSFGAERMAEPTMMMAAPPPLPLAGGDTMSFMQFEMTGPAEVIAGKPYSARLTVEVLQPLIDGNSITVEHHSRVFRDAEGRTRRDDELGIGGVIQHSVLVADPPAAPAVSMSRCRHRWRLTNRCRWTPRCIPLRPRIFPPTRRSSCRFRAIPTASVWARRPSKACA
jgi:hypothetical protein